MTNPVLVEVVRGTLVESVHSGALHVVDGDGKTVLSIGDVDRLIYPRSAIKALQALPLVESGAPERFGLGDAELAIACASHNGEDSHVATAKGMLASAGHSEATLECGPHWPNLWLEPALELARAHKTPTQLHNNCSGKHAGFVCLACATGHDPQGYIAPAHPVQRFVAQSISDMTDFRIDQDSVYGIDGCSAPNWALPLHALALGFARFATGHGVGPERAKAAARLRQAVAARPDMVAGTKRFDTEVMRLLGARAFIKVGAEGVYCASLPEPGLGVAIKIDDGATRAAEVVMAEILARFLNLPEALSAGLERFRKPEIANWRGTRTGFVRASGPLLPNAR